MPGSLQALEWPSPAPRSLLTTAEAVELEPDARLALCSTAGDIVARCSLWWRHTPRLDGRTVGFIGHYEAHDPRSAARLLRMAGRRLAGCGRSIAVGPVDGSTWMSYRHVIETSSEPPFFLEPRNPPEWPQQFVAAGFSPLAFYRSSVQEDLDSGDERVCAANVRLHELGVRIRALDMRRIDDELRAIHALSLESFAGAILFSRVSFESFVARYRPLLRYVDCGLVMLAEHHGRLVGFLFAVPDVLQPSRGEAVDTMIVKTVAVSSERRYAGLGHVLAMSGAARARAIGYKRAIHALMHEANGAASWSARLGRPIRRYAVFSKELDAHL